MAPIIDQRTPHYSLEVPSQDGSGSNDISVAMVRIKTAFTKIDQILKDQETATTGKAETDHSHALADVTGLVDALNQLSGDINAIPTTLAGLTDTQTTGVSEGMLLQFLNSKFQAVVARAAQFGIDPITGIAANNVQEALAALKTAIDTKAASSSLGALAAKEQVGTGDFKVEESRTALGTKVQTRNQAVTGIPQFLNPVTGNWQGFQSGIAPIFDQAYTNASGVLGASDDGKSYVMDLGIQPHFNIGAVADLPIGWTVTLLVIGAPSAFQVAAIEVAAGNISYKSDLHGTSFYLIGRGEAFRLTKTADGALSVFTLVNPPNVRNYGYYTGAAAWNSGLTSWTGIPLNASTQHLDLVYRQTGGGTVAVSGLYAIRARVYYSIQTANHTGTGYLRIFAGGEELFYSWIGVGGGPASAITGSNSIYLKQGFVIDARQLSSDSLVYYYPPNGLVGIDLIGR
ncbi:MAG: hypothetical protein ABJL55_16315 [Roseibium sp.]